MSSIPEPSEPELAGISMIRISAEPGNGGPTTPSARGRRWRWEKSERTARGSEKERWGTPVPHFQRGVAGNTTTAQGVTMPAHFELTLCMILFSFRSDHPRL
jgi:hypothetical protein